jgi:HAD superfamily hydrolase (TIGR01490 family)
MSRLAFFDLDHTLLAGDSDVLWCEHLIAEGVLDRAEFEPRNRAMAERYARGEATPAEFCGFYAQTLAGAPSEPWLERRARWFEQAIAPRLGDAARALVAEHRLRGDRVVLTTATSRWLVEPSAAELGIVDLLATELEVGADGRYTGRLDGTPNMRAGKLERVHAWLRQESYGPQALAEASFYSDSANDLPLLLEVGHPVAVDPDPLLAEHAREHGWRVIHLPR